MAISMDPPNPHYLPPTNIAALTVERLYMCVFFSLPVGLGYASVMVSWIIGVYYQVIIAICLFFLFKSMTSTLPWTDCNNPWNTPACRTLDQLTSNATNTTMNYTTSYMSTTMSMMNTTNMSGKEGQG